MVVDEAQIDLVAEVLLTNGDRHPEPPTLPLLDAVEERARLAH